MKKVLCSFLSLLLFFTCYSQSTQTNIEDARKSILLLNYVALKSQEIDSNRTNRIRLNDIQLEIVDNLTYQVDDITQQELNNLWDSIDKYKLNSKQRDRLLYIAEQEKAQALKDAIPDPMYILSIAASGNPKKAIMAIICAATDSFISYNTSKNKIELEILKQNWKLEDDEYKSFSEKTKNLLNYCQDIAKNYKIFDEIAIRPSDIEKFIEYQNDNNLIRRRDNLIYETKYKNAMFTPYYILLGNTYYELAELYEKEHPNNTDKKYLNNLYNECINCYNEYINIIKNNRIYIHDFELAGFLPKVIYAAEKVLPTNQYVIFASNCIESIERETIQSNWELRYYASVIAVQLAEKDPSRKKYYYDMAGRFLMSNIRYLSLEQEKVIEAYIKPIDTKMPDDVLTKKDKNTFNDMIEQQEKSRKSELIPFNTALNLNTELLFWLTKYDSNLKEKWNKDISQIISDSINNEVLRSKYGLTQISDFSINNSSEADGEINLSSEDVLKENKTVKKIVSDTVLSVMFPVYYITSKTIFVGDKTKTITLPAVFLSDSSVITINAIKEDSREEWTQEIKLAEIKNQIKVIRPEKKSFSNDKEYLTDMKVVLNLKKTIEKKNLSSFDNVFIVIKDFDHSIVINCTQNDLSKSNKVISKIKSLLPKSKE